MSLMMIAALALQFPPPNPAEAVQVQGPSRICVGQLSYAAEAGETVTLDYAGIHWAGIKVRGPQGTFTIRTGDMLTAPWDELRFRVRGTSYRAYSYPNLEGIDRIRIFGYLPHDPSRFRTIAMVEGRTNRDEVGRDVLNRISTESADQASCSHRLDYGRHMGERG